MYYGAVMVPYNLLQFTVFYRLEPSIRSYFFNKIEGVFQWSFSLIFQFCTIIISSIQQYKFALLFQYYSLLI